jgi:flotillin
MEAEAEAEAVSLKGDAEAFAIEVKAKAEAEQMAKKADAWKEYKEAAMVDMMLQTLPKVRNLSARMVEIVFFSRKITLMRQFALHNL